jgi:hypothetical protein
LKIEEEDDINNNNNNNNNNNDNNNNNNNSRPRPDGWSTLWCRSRKVAGAIPDGVTGIIQRRKLSGCTKFLSSAQPLTEMTTSVFPAG